MPPTLHIGVSVDQEYCWNCVGSGRVSSLLSGVACISMSHADLGRRRPAGEPYCMPASLAVGRHPPNAPFQPSPCGPSYATSRGGHNADWSTEFVVSFNDIY